MDSDRLVSRSLSRGLLVGLALLLGSRPRLLGFRLFSGPRLSFPDPTFSPSGFRPLQTPHGTLPTPDPRDSHTSFSLRSLVDGESPYRVVFPDWCRPDPVQKWEINVSAPFQVPQDSLPDPSSPPYDALEPRF